MKKIFIIVLIGLFLSPLQMVADHYEYDQLMSFPNPPVKTPVLYQLSFDLDYDTGNLVITTSNEITDLNITITGNWTTYLNATVSLSAGQSYTDCLNYLSEGTYILTLSTVNGIISQYEIRVTDD